MCKGNFLELALLMERTQHFPGHGGEGGGAGMEAGAHIGGKRALGEGSQHFLCPAGLEELQGSCALWGLLGALALFYLLSLVCNVLCCLRYKKVRGRYRWGQGHPRASPSPCALSHQLFLGQG